MGGPRNAAYIWAIVALAIVAAASIIPTPFYLLAPGNAVELGSRIAVRDHRPPARHFYLTDVTLARASVLLLAGRFVPGTQVVRRETVVPQGVSAKSYDRLLSDAMSDSQNVAALVAERAAGYRVTLPTPEFAIGNVLADSHASGVLFPGDVVVAVAGRRVTTFDGVARAVRAFPAGTRVPLRIERAGHPMNLAIKTTDDGSGARLGIALRERDATAHLPVAVRFSIADISGSSGGLMFALEIYAALRATRGGEPVAGTGTIRSDGTVGPIEGTRQKVIAAERAGARVFLVPRENYADVATERGIRIIPVGNFAQALRAIGLPPTTSRKLATRD